MAAIATIPEHLKHGINRCRGNLSRIQAEIDACLNDMATGEDVDLTEEVDRLNEQANAERRKLATYENAAAVAADHVHENQRDVDARRIVERRERLARLQEHRQAVLGDLRGLVGQFIQRKRDLDSLNDLCVGAGLAVFSDENAGEPQELVMRRRQLLDFRIHAPLLTAFEEAIKVHGAQVTQ